MPPNEKKKESESGCALRVKRKKGKKGDDGLSQGRYTRQARGRKRETGMPWQDSGHLEKRPLGGQIKSGLSHRYRIDTGATQTERGKRGKRKE